MAADRMVWDFWLWDAMKPAHIYTNVPRLGISLNIMPCLGARSQSAKTYLEKHFESFAEASLEELVRHGLCALRDTLQQDKDLNTFNCSVGVVGVDQKFEVIEEERLQGYLDLLTPVGGAEEPTAQGGEAPMDTEEA